MRRTRQNIERIPPRARLSLSLAQAACEHFQHGLIEPEHTLLGLYDERDGYAGQVLRELGMTRQMIVNVLVLRLQKQPDTAIALADATKKMLEQAVHEARRRSLDTIGTGCMLLGILSLNRPLTQTILLQNNLSVNEVVAKVNEIFSAKHIPYDEHFSVKPSQPTDFLSFVSRLFSRPEPQPTGRTSPSTDDRESYHRSVVEVLTDVSKIYPNDINIILNLARHQILAKDYRGITATLGLLQEVDKLGYAATRLHAAAIFNLGDYEKTIVECNLHLEQNPDDGLLYYLRGSAYRELKERAKAVTDLKKALEFWDKIDLFTDADARKQQIIEYLAEGEEDKSE